MQPDEIIPFFKSLKRASKERMKEIAADEYGYCPFIRDNMDMPREFSKITMDQRWEAIDWAHNNVFKFKYFYDEQFGLLGVMGVTKALRNLFDCTVQFQNSTDQDYQRKEWEGIEEFENIFDKWMRMPSGDVKVFYGGEFNDDFDSDYAEYANDQNKLNEKLNYVRRYLCYKEIWSRYEKYLWEHDEFLYISLYGYGERSDVMPLVQYCHEAQVKWQDDFEREWIAKHGSLTNED
jgi:hypothetical protein